MNILKYPDILTVVYVSFQTAVLKDAAEYECSLTNLQMFILSFPRQCSRHFY